MTKPRRQRPHQAVWLSAPRVATMNALLYVHARDGRATFDTVATETGRHRSTVYRQLAALESLGLVTGLHGVAGQLRPAVEITTCTASRVLA